MVMDGTHYMMALIDSINWTALMDSFKALLMTSSMMTLSCNNIFVVSYMKHYYNA